MPTESLTYAEAFLPLALGFLLAQMLIMLVPLFFFLRTSQHTLELCGRERQMAPGLVWVSLVPILNMAWLYLTVVNVSKSMDQVLRRRGRDSRDDGWLLLGVGFVTLLLLSSIPWIGIPIALIAVVLWIRYWQHLLQFNHMLEQGSWVHQAAR